MTTHFNENRISSVSFDVAAVAIVSRITRALALVCIACLVMPYVLFAEEGIGDTGASHDEPEVLMSDRDLEALSIIAAEEEWQKENEKKPEDAPLAPETGDGIQATFNTQEVVVAATLEGTENPETATSTESNVVGTLPSEDTATSTEQVVIPIVLGEATSTDAGETESSEGEFIAGATSLEVIDGNVTEGEVVEPAVIDVITVIEPLPVVDSVIAAVASEPEPEFEFALTGKQIPTKKSVTTSDGFSKGDEEIGTTLTPIIDNETGTMRIAGQCSDVYFVVLLFKKEGDYRKDPRSYILNQAFPCENGQFTYSISELPHTLPSGTYYLLVGQQGNRGAWTPITALTEITINRN